MLRKSPIPLEVVTVKLFEGDRERLKELYPKVGYNRAIRQLIRKHLDELEAEMDQRPQERPQLHG